MANQETLFVKYFGNTPLIKVMEYFIENDLYDHSKTDVYTETGVARSTLHHIIDDLLKKGIIVKTREVGRAGMYKLNRSNHVVEAMVDSAINVVLAAAKAETSVTEISTQSN